MYKSLLAGLGLAALVTVGCDKEYPFYSSGGKFVIEVSDQEAWAKYLWFREQNGKRANTYDQLAGILLQLDQDGDGKVAEENITPLLNCEQGKYLSRQKDDCINPPADSSDFCSRLNHLFD